MPFTSLASHRLMACGLTGVGSGITLATRQDGNMVAVLFSCPCDHAFLIGAI
jgi:hypothetical protein